MTRLNLALLVAVLCSAFYLVHLQYESRRLYVAMERAKSLSERLAADHEQLVVQKRAQATPARVQQLAVRQLQMRPAHPGITEYVAPPAVAGADGAVRGRLQVLQGPEGQP
ncbi:cell division protein FtsL [Macromonas nakdongensis]|jgi:cell division protein FtsL|uniref:cell division protein FtsL n=1 Tax=Macromonas nakdongensis TaxID=1843082 RepID=UPI000C32DDF8|nr:cell division protein FtsL [Macromonas nakdongensis]